MKTRTSKPLPQSSGTAPDVEGERLQKILARAGVASRRAAEEMISQGRVRVNGEVVTEMGTRADPSKDKIEVDGQPVAIQSADERATAFTYIMLNKPPGVVATAKDPQGRQTVLDLVTAATDHRPPTNGGSK